jgi:phosphatidylserine decarboxylase
VLKSENFGSILMMEVGALLVGKIVNYHEEEYVKRGEEKGRFEFGGSTVVLCIKRDKIRVDEDIIKNSKMNIETVVKMGEKIGETYAG